MGGEQTANEAEGRVIISSNLINCKSMPDYSECTVVRSTHRSSECYMFPCLALPSFIIFPLIRVPKVALVKFLLNTLVLFVVISVWNEHCPRYRVVKRYPFMFFIQGHSSKFRDFLIFSTFGDQ